MKTDWELWELRVARYRHPNGSVFLTVNILDQMFDDLVLVWYKLVKIKSYQIVLSSINDIEAQANIYIKIHDRFKLFYPNETLFNTTRTNGLILIS
jgi:hypothetical protein